MHHSVKFVHEIEPGLTNLDDTASNNVVSDDVGTLGSRITESVHQLGTITLLDTADSGIDIKGDLATFKDPPYAMSGVCGRCLPCCEVSGVVLSQSHSQIDHPLNEGMTVRSPLDTKFWLDLQLQTLIPERGVELENGR
jgi:hypothetical protein